MTIFFAISGFIITHLLVRERERTARFDLRGFYLRRIFKLFPPFMVIILIPTVIFALVGGDVAWSYVASQVFFFFNWAMIYLPWGPIQILPGSIVVWSLSIEEQFYLVFSLLWILLSRSRNYLLMLAIIGVLGVIVPNVLRFVMVSGPDAADRIYLGTDTRADGLALGILTAVAYACVRAGRLPRLERAMRKPVWLFVAISVFFVTLVIRDEWFRDTVRYTLQAASGSIVILWGLVDSRSAVRRAFGRITEWQVVQIVGLASYSIYLVHAPLNALIAPYLSALPKGVTAAILIVVGTVAGVLVWATVEKQAETWKARVLHREASANGATQAAGRAS